jgi:predicted DNA repair protein MutK
MPEVGGVTVGTNLANTTTGNPLVPVGDSAEIAAVNAVNQAAEKGVAQAVSWVLQTLGAFLSNFVTGFISAVRSTTGTHLLGLVVGLVVVVVMFH